MAPDQSAKDAFVAAIEAKIVAWTEVLDSYRRAASLDGPLGEVAGATNGASRQGRPEAGRLIDLPVGVFRDKSIKEAIQIYLEAGRRKQTNKEIAVGLQKGGIATTSTNFEATVATALGRMKDEGTILRFPDGWDLASSYPETLRSRLEKDAKPKRQQRTEKKSSPAKKPAGRPTPDKTEQILALILSDPLGKDVGDVVAWFKARGTECSRDYVRVVAKRLLSRGLIESRGGRLYPPNRNQRAAQ